MDKQIKIREGLIAKLGLQDIKNPAWKVINDESFEHGVGLIVTRYNRVINKNKIQPYDLPIQITSAIQNIIVVHDYYRTNHQISMLKLNRIIDYRQSKK